jgi:hypothetical protein
MVLAGEPPATRRAFSGTYLAALPGANVARRYWLALAARLLLLETVRRTARPVHDDPRGIAIMGLSGGEIYGPAADRLTTQDLALLQREMTACFWNRRWLATVPAGMEEAHAFVDRPVITYGDSGSPLPDKPPIPVRLCPTNHLRISESMFAEGGQS